MANVHGFYKRYAGYSIVLFIAGVIVLSFLLLSAFKDNAGREAQVTQVSSPFIPEKLEFCGEQVPIEYFDVFESLEKEIIVNTYYHSQTILFIKKANRYFPVIENILKKYDIPDDFKYLVVAESGLSNVVSPADARGFWQLLAGTAKDYGLEVNDEVDERYHLEKATEAACKFLLHSYEVYNNWTLVAATYNTGRRGVERQIERQGEKDYYDLLFVEETARYVFRIIAIKLVLEDPSLYGFNIGKDELYEPIRYKVVTVSGPVENWGEFAKQHGTSYKLLKLLNPWLRDKMLTNKYNREYLVKIPSSRTLN
jgi:hypothetical protein